MAERRTRPRSMKRVHKPAMILSAVRNLKPARIANRPKHQTTTRKRLGPPWSTLAVSWRSVAAHRSGAARRHSLPGEQLANGKPRTLLKGTDKTLNIGLASPFGTSANLMNTETFEFPRTTVVGIRPPEKTDWRLVTISQSAASVRLCTLEDHREWGATKLKQRSARLRAALRRSRGRQSDGNGDPDTCTSVACDRCRGIGE
jgi:hypothetical protein